MPQIYVSSSKKAKEAVSGAISGALAASSSSASEFIASTRKTADSDVSNFPVSSSSTSQSEARVHYSSSNMTVYNIQGGGQQFSSSSSSSSLSAQSNTSLTRSPNPLRLRLKRPYEQSQGARVQCISLPASVGASELSRRPFSSPERATISVCQSSLSRNTDINVAAAASQQSALQSDASDSCTNSEEFNLI